VQFHRVFNDMRVREARGQLGNVNAATATVALALAAGCAAFFRNYFGPAYAEEQQRATEARRAMSSDEIAGQIQEALLSELTRDVRPAMRHVQEAASTDFSTILENVRQRVVRERYQPVTDTELMMLVRTPNIVSDFKQIRGVRWSGFDELTLSPEAADLEFAEIGQTTDYYAVAKYRKGVKLTYELIKNDNVQMFVNALGALGDAARRTRALIVLRALETGTTAVQFNSAVGGPTIERIDDMISNASTGFAAETITNADGSTTEMGTKPTDIFVPVKWGTMLMSALDSQFAPSASTSARNPQANPVYKTATPHVDRLMGTVFGSDWLAVDMMAPPVVEQAVLDDFAAGPRTLTQMPDIVEAENFGDFLTMSSGVQVADATAAKVTSTKGLRRVDGI
jgi:hypothetical protein